MKTFKSLIQFNLAHRWVVLGFFLLVTALAATQVYKLRFDFSPEAMLEFSQEEIDYQHAFNEKFATNPNQFLVVFSDEKPLYTPQALGDLRDLTAILRDVDYVESVYSLTEVPDNSKAGAGALLTGKLDPMVPEGEIPAEAAAALEQRVASSDLLQGNLISENGRHAMIIVTVSQEVAEPADFYPVYEKLDQTVKSWQSEQNHSAYDIAYGGLPYIRAMTVYTMKREQFILWPVVGVLYIIALCFVFRSLWQAVMPLLCIACVIVWAIAIMVLADMPVTMINNTLPLLILVIGVTNGIYVLMRMLDERRKGKDKMVAIGDGVYRVSLATFLTTLTTSIGFGSLLIAKTKILNGFGGITALAVMLIYVAIIFLMPQVASLFKLEAKKSQSADEARDGRIERFVGCLANFSINHHRLVIGLSIAALCICLGVASQIRFNSKVNDVFEDSHPIAQTNVLIEKELGGMLPVELDIWAEDENFFREVDNMQRVCALQNELLKHDDIISAISLCNMAAEAGVDWQAETPDQRRYSGALLGIRRLQPDRFNSVITEKGNNVHIMLRIPDNGYEHAKTIIADIRTIAARAFDNSPIQYRLTGIGYNSTLGLDHFMTDLFTSLLTAFVIIFALLFISFRSFWSGAVAILPNLLPISMTLAILPLYGFNMNTTTVLVFTISIGLAVDNSIHIIQRFRQEYRGDRSVSDALRIAMKSSGRAIMQSNVLLCAGLAVLLGSTFDPVRRVGALTVTTIFAALIVSIILLPAEIVCVGHKMRLPRFKKDAKALTDASETVAAPDSDAPVTDAAPKTAETPQSSVAKDVQTTSLPKPKDVQTTSLPKTAENAA